MAAFRIANLKKTWYYLKKNGLSAACLAAAERLSESRRTPYVYEPPEEDVLREQRGTDISRLRISVVVPAFSPREAHLTALLDSLYAQTYPHWELVIADAGADGGTERLAERWAGAHGLTFERAAQRPGTDGTAEGEALWKDGAVRYLKLDRNLGISRNTNAGLACARGDYTGLLDHDDLLTPDALFETASAVEAGKKAGRQPLMLYSDEDKCDGAGSRFFEPNLKPDLDPDLLLSNNYVCHFLVTESALIRELGMRPEFDGAQDYDLVLRAAARGVPFFHIKKVLYHWRCHEDSTAQNPESKAYAYEAGRRAVEAFLKQTGRRAKVSHLKHLGFYRADYEGDIFAQRPDLGAVAGPLPPEKGRFRSGIYEPAENEVPRESAKSEGLREQADSKAPQKSAADGGCAEPEEKITMRFEGLRNGFSGPMHRAALQQDVEAADLRTMRVREELSGLYAQALQQAARDAERSGEEEAVRRASLEFCAKLRGMGWRILWDPQGAGGREKT